MIVQFSILPMDSTHISGDVHAAAKILADRGFEYQVGPIGTCVKGEWREVLSAIEKCHEAAMQKHDRVVTTITIDDRRDAEHSLRGAVRAVEAAARSERVPTDTTLYEGETSLS